MVRGDTFRATGIGIGIGIGIGTNHAITVSAGSLQAGSTGNTMTAGSCSAAGVNSGSIGLAGGATCP